MSTSTMVSHTTWLEARAIGKSVFFASQSHADAPGLWPDVVPPALLLAAMELSQGLPPDDSSRPLVRLAFRGPLRDEDRAALGGATLVLLNPDAHASLDAPTCERWAELGVRRLLVADPYTGGAIELVFKGRHADDRGRAVRELYKKRIFTASNDIPLTAAGAAPLQPEAGHMLIAGPAPVPLAPDRELCWNYYAFEGDRALPPLERSHDEIRASGNGRYSVYNQYFFVSRIAPGQGSDPFWLVERTPDTERRAPMTVFRKKAPEPLTGKATYEALGGLLGTDPGRVALSPGDRIAVCTHCLASGSAERQWVFLAQALKSRGFEVTFVCYEPLEGKNAHYLRLLTEADVRVLDASQIPVMTQIACLPKTADALAVLRSDLPRKEVILRLNAAFVELRPKAVFCQLDGGNLLGGFAAHLANVPRLVMSFRNYNPTHFAYLDAPWLKPAYQLLARSPRVRYSGNHRGANDDYADWIGIPRHLVHFVPNAIDAESFPLPTAPELDALRAELGIACDVKVVLSVFRFSAEKDPETFLAAAMAILDAEPGVIVLHAGGGPQDAARARIAAEGLSDRLRLLGQRSDINVLMGLSDVFLLASLKEGMPNVVAEAQLIGRPVVATAAGGTPDSVVDGVTATLCQIGDAPGLAAACLSLIRDPERARNMGDAGRAHVLNNFRKSAMADGYLRVVSCDRRPEPRPAPRYGSWLGIKSVMRWLLSLGSSPFKVEK